jgi:hypothetical protein
VTQRKKRKVQCKACGQTSHELSRCFYAFPEIRFKGFKPNDELIEKASKALENLTLAKEVEAIRKERKNKEAEGK